MGMNCAHIMETTLEHNQAGLDLEPPQGKRNSWKMSGGTQGKGKILEGSREDRSTTNQLEEVHKCSPKSQRVM